MLTLIVSIIVFLFVILIHEFGHFIVAKKSGIGVKEFSIGMGPKIISKTKNGTKYSLRVLPIGGYCMLEGEDEESSKPDSFNNAPVKKRLLTIIAGALMNFICALVLCVLLMSFMKPVIAIREIKSNSPSYYADFKEGDQIISINGKVPESDRHILSLITESKGKSLNFEVLRGSQKKTLHVVPKENNGKYQIGISFGSGYSKGGFSIINGIKNGITMFLSLVGMIYSVLWKLITLNLSLSNLSGPVGVIKQIGNAASMGISNVLFFIIYININLGVFNLLPIPALDGGRAMFLLYEMFTHKKISKDREATIHFVGLVLLLSLILIVSIKDIINLF